MDLLHPEVAHYAGQWKKIMVTDLDRDARGFSVSGDELPRGIAPSENADALLDVALRHAGPEVGASYRQPGSRVLWVGGEVNPNNTWHFAHEVESINEHGITPLPEKLAPWAAPRQPEKAEKGSGAEGI